MQLDTALAAIPWVKPWSVDALQVRLDWRTRVATPQARRAFADEALTLVDRALIVQPTSALFGLRARAAIAADRPEMIVESIASYAQAMYATALRLPAGAPRNRARTTLQGLTRVLEETGTRSPALEPRAQAVRARILDQLSKL